MTRKEAIKYLRSLVLVGTANKDAIAKAIAALEYILLPCPFCGTSSVNLIEDDEDDKSEDERAYIYCPHCFATVHFLAREETAIKKWNRRYVETPEVEQAE